MANLIKKKFIGADQVGSAQLLIEKDEAVRVVKQDNSTVELIGLNASDQVVVLGERVATLDINGKLPSSQLTVEAFEYKGNWSAATNSPTLADGTGNAGDVYNVSAAGTVDFGAGGIEFAIGDKVVYNGSIWEKWDLTQIAAPVTSVNGETGAVVLTTDDIDEGITPTNLWFTDQRAKDAVVNDSITDGNTDTAPSENAVFDALALKQDALASGKEKITLIAGDITAGYIDLAQEVFHLSAFVDRLAIHETEDYTLSVVGGVTRITFTGDLVSPGQSMLTAGDNIFVKYLYLA